MVEKVFYGMMILEAVIAMILSSCSNEPDGW
jgi:carbon starvation protein CstA